MDGLSAVDAQDFLRAIGISGSDMELRALNDCYSGNPFALKVIALILKEFFGGNVSEFLKQNTIVLSDPLSGVLQQQFDRLSELEREIVYWLAIAESSVSLKQLEELLSLPLSQMQILEALISLQARSLIEGIVTDRGVQFGLRPMMQKLVRDDLVEQATAELCAALKSQNLELLDVLRRYSFVNSFLDTSSVNQKLLLGLKISLICNFKPANKLTLKLTQLLAQLRSSSEETGYSDRNLADLIKLFD